ncbi:hypothetical protein COW36_09715 [bacterium (Candidatus Blackallbacteria) CG17_big_fil_post_rev_8_21_14_2_50_48_46]|uniref:Lipocalin/cytosolic fatty-acid binding domain-containing protein n=1 Tax=bacterium (Candidatus Blackallbacteria) CG17_big_fil_post_rev_8_21_14_2_50_48_46 TaxID=2014261 RepID=A0A2M7G5V5_9BACT|nr:MAG: hypothetical protein COW64_01695 [bacterium (Candidatus Blackallbacteria) CG18_big_fil_WC_8_21_14_2_50_49_26]PIW17237.1 MAG: hypothetical protein COW36_09715 [bacterium (Candidatus Blackallbacteria) CG17_big_fil_post_rev_8_21_14_2_50_48_46]PIW51029.1 MAG: hypothetical protein COW20_00725 [bacterium (Candidatus Blackallbacteria) CG13_big_fil_rev_8_21_14_2_50_49_14]
MKVLAALLLAFGILHSNPACAQSELETVSELDIKLFAGLWFEVASYPAPFQSPDCSGTTASYTFNPNGEVKVWNQCYLTQKRKLETIEGRAWVPNPLEPGKLKVSFFAPLSADYWVIALDSAYRYAVIGHPSRKFLWILSRSPEMDEQTYSVILERVATKGYDLAKIRRTPSLAQALFHQKFY